jgi:hypothetical protein
MMTRPSTCGRAMPVALVGRATRPTTAPRDRPPMKGQQAKGSVAQANDYWDTHRQNRSGAHRVIIWMQAAVPVAASSPAECLPGPGTYRTGESGRPHHKQPIGSPRAEWRSSRMAVRPTSPLALLVRLWLTRATRRCGRERGLEPLGRRGGPDVRTPPLPESDNTDPRKPA